MLYEVITLSEGNLTGTFHNDSEQTLESVAIVLGSAVAALGDVAPGQTVPGRLVMAANPFGPGVPDQVIGAAFDSADEAGIRRMVRYNMVSRITSYNVCYTKLLRAITKACVLPFQG